VNISLLWRSPRFLSLENLALAVFAAALFRCTFYQLFLPHPNLTSVVYGLDGEGRAGRS
jgi:hypothetical protein